MRRPVYDVQSSTRAVAGVKKYTKFILCGAHIILGQAKVVNVHFVHVIYGARPLSFRPPSGWEFGNAFGPFGNGSRFTKGNSDHSDADFSSLFRSTSFPKRAEVTFFCALSGLTLSQNRCAFFEVLSGEGLLFRVRVDPNHSNACFYLT